VFYSLARSDIQRGLSEFVPNVCTSTEGKQDPDDVKMPLAYSLMQRSISVLAWRVNIRRAVKKRVDLFKISSTCGYIKRTLSKNSRLVDVCQFHFGKRRRVLVFITP